MTRDGRDTGLVAALAAAFGDDAPVPIMWSDSHSLIALFRSLGFPSQHFEDLEDDQVFVGNAVLIPTLTDNRRESAFFHEKFDRASCPVIPLRSFGTGEAAERYLITALTQISFTDAAAGVKRFVRLLANASVPLQVQSSLGTRLTVDLGDDLQLVTPKGETHIAPGEWVSIAQFLEVGIVPQASTNTFSMSGQLVADGVSIAHHVIRPHAARPPAERAWNTVQSLRSASKFPLRVVIEANRCVDILTSDSESVAAELLAYTDEVLRGELIELAISTVSMGTRPDWSVNSQINEAWGGCHLAFGMGLDGAHIDFVDTKATIAA